MLAYGLGAQSGVKVSCFSATQPVTFYWTGNENDLYINYTICDQLRFDDIYEYWTPANGLGCEITLKSRPEAPLYSSEGYLLQSVKLMAILTNTDKQDVVQYSIVSKFSYLNLKNTSLPVYLTAESKAVGTVKNPMINLSKMPKFYILKDSHGVIAFKNAFPYSQITE